jgi:crotonobetaine/carnitine-CoA ligase
MKSPLDVLRLYPEHDGTLGSVFAGRARPAPDRPFLLYAGTTWSWRAFGDATERAARVLASRGVGKGDRVAVMARNGDGHILLLFAVARLGAILVPVNPEFGVEEARYVLGHAAPRGIVASGETLATARRAVEGIVPTPWFMTLDGAASDAPDLHDLIATAPDGAMPGCGGADDTCVIIYTSGTTGFPKGVMHSQRSFVTAGEAFVQRVHLQETDRALIILPLFHVNALFYSVAGVLAAGASMVVVTKFSASNFWPTVVETQSTVTNIIEAIGTILQARPRGEFRAEHRLRAVYGVRQSVAATFRDEFHIPDLVGGYGMSEIPGVTSTPLDVPRKPGSMGPIGSHPDPSRRWAEARIVDDEGRDVAANEIGELWVKTPIVMQGYFRDPAQTEASFRDLWFMTGDLVRRDEDGWFYFVSRKKDIIRRRGENIAGAELDRVIGEHPGVLEVAAIAVPAELGEDEILAAIVPRPGHAPSAAEIAAWCRARLAAMKVPRYVLFLDALPHTATHKIAKATLRQDPMLKSRAVDLHSPLPTSVSIPTPPSRGRG